jgi:hypothetical protein
MKRYIESTLLFATLMLASLHAHAQRTECINVDGLRFEKVGVDTLLFVKDGKNLGLLKVYGSLYNDLKDVRFFTPTICTKEPNNKFQYNASLQTVESITLFTR